MYILIKQHNIIKQTEAYQNKKKNKFRFYYYNL